MAHADYHCCALCDKKLEYASNGFYNAKTKEDLCTDCQKALHEHGVMVYDGSELADWLEREDAETVAEVFSGVRYRMCHYDNRVDAAFCETTGIERKRGHSVTHEDLSHLLE